MSATQVSVMRRYAVPSNGGLTLTAHGAPLVGLSHPACMKMPPEILSKIFLLHMLYLREEHLQNLLDPWRDGPTPRYYKWILVTHVCRYWRDVAHHYAKLWTFVALQPRTVPGVLHPDVMQRAGTLPLSIVYHQTRSRTPEGKAWRTPAVAHIGHLLPRMQNLYLVLDDTDCTAGELCGALRRPAKRLESLHIAFGSERPCQFVAQNREIPPLLFESTLPMLHTLTISNGNFAWNNSLFRPSLRHLEIIHRKRLEPGVDGMRMFIDMLATLPLLETFIIDSVPECSAVEQVVTLSNLRLLEVRGTVRKTALLLSHLRFPTSATISIGIPCDGISAVNARELQSLIQALLPILQEEPLQTISYAVASPGVHTPDAVRAWAGDSADGDHPSPEVGPRLILTGDGSRALDPVLRGLDLSHVRSVDISGLASSAPRPGWLEGVPDVALLHLEEDDSSAVDATEEAQAIPEHPQRPASYSPAPSHALHYHAAQTTAWSGGLLEPQEGLYMGPKLSLPPLGEVLGGVSGPWVYGPAQTKDSGHQGYRLGGVHSCVACAGPAEQFKHQLPSLLGWWGGDDC